MRPAGKLKLGYFPLPSDEAARIRRFLRPPASQYAALDPCIGNGSAFAVIASDTLVLRYGIELDSYRAEQACQITTRAIHGDACNVHCPVESFSLLYLNPPYDFECGDGHNRRMELIFLEHCYRWLKPGGVLVLVVPGDRLAVCDQILAIHFRDKKAYRLSAPDSEKYRQVVLFGIRRTRRERDRVQDADVTRARGLIAKMSRTWDELPPLPDMPDAAYSIPESAPVELVYRGLPLDEIEDRLPKSAAWRQANRILFGRPKQVTGRPLTPLHGGHVALCAVSGMLDGVFGSGTNLHLAAWNAVKVTYQTEEVEDDGTVVRRERERFVNELTLVFASGQTTTLR
jgi:hypothetical protein